MHPEHTGSQMTRILGALTLAGFAAVLVLALVVSPPDQVQGDAARLIYLHVPVAMAMNIGFALNAAGSAMWLWKKSRWWDTVAVSAAEVHVRPMRRAKASASAPETAMSGSSDMFGDAPDRG